jgi:hypothetical protein
MFAFQGLNTCHFVNTFKSFSLLAALSRLLVTGVDIVHLLVKALIRRWRQPVTDLMGFEITLFLKAWPHVGRRSFLRCLFS